MTDLISFKNAQIEALQVAVAESDAYVMQLESFIFELTDKDSPEEYKAVIRNEIFNTQEDEQ